jgi:hypothetical protein
MGNLFKRKRKGDKEPSPIWQMRYRVWDQQASAWGRFKYESTHTTNEVEAASLLLDRERREERRKNGLEACAAKRIALGKALTDFLDKTQAWDRAVPERNRKAKHPILGIDVQGTSWWIRTLDFAGEVFRFFGDVEIKAIVEPGALEAYDKDLSMNGGVRRSGVSPSTRHKMLVWFRRFHEVVHEKGLLDEGSFRRLRSTKGDRRAPRPNSHRRGRSDVLGRVRKAAGQSQGPGGAGAP